jgi:hypothetical protein
VDKKTFGKKADFVLGTFMKELGYTIDIGKLPIGERRKVKLVRNIMKRSHKLTGKSVPRLVRDNEVEWL